MHSLFADIVVWVLASVVISLAVGFYLGRNTRQQKEQRSAETDRQAALSALVELLKSVEDLTSDVDLRSTEMQAVRSHVDDIQTNGELEMVRQVLLKQVATVLESNQKLEDDLGYARCRMEEQAEELDRTRREVHLDALSGVGNRKAFDEKLLLLSGGFKRGGEAFVLIMADMDHFKWVNDTHGHQAGDHVLKELGNLLKRCVRDGDFVCRYGGDEFGVMLPRCGLEVGMKIADRLRVECTRTNFGLGSSREEAAVTLSLGVALAQQGDTSETLLARADHALYASKNSGRNRVHFQPTPEQAEESRTKAAEARRLAEEQRNLAAANQPQDTLVQHSA